MASTDELEVTRNAYRYHDQVDRGMRDQVGRIIERKRNRKLSFSSPRTLSRRVETATSSRSGTDRIAGTCVVDAQPLAR